MGLPIWRDPDEKKSSRSQPKPDPTACLRSSIRRRPSVHGRRQTRTRLPRDPTVLPPRFERSPPPSSGFNGLRDARRGQERGVPPISSLLEAADRHTATAHPPPPVPESRNYNREVGFEDPRDAPDVAYFRSRIARHVSPHDAHMRRELVELRARGDALERERDQILREAEATGRGAEIRAVFETDSLTAEPIHTIVLNPGQPLRIIRSPEPMSTRSRPDSRNGTFARRSTLPTPPLDTSGPEESIAVDDMDSIDSTRARAGRRSHPLSNSWRAESPIDGLGDRNRSPTPGDGWEIMRTTITPDETLPSAESSFTSAAASQSFNDSSNNTNITEPDTSSNENSRRGSRLRAESVSSVDADDLVCSEEDQLAQEAFAEDMYFHEIETAEGRARIAHHERLRQEEGNRLAEPSQPTRVEIGFRLLEEAFETHEGAERLAQVRRVSPETLRHYHEMLDEGRRLRDRRRRRAMADRVPSPRPERYGEATTNVANESRRQVHDYFRRIGADSLETRSTSPPPYEPLNSHPDVTTFTSREEPSAHPVSPPSARVEREVSDSLLSGSDAQDLDSMRRIVERLAARDDVPEEWWTSIGLNLSRTRPQTRSPPSRRRRSRSPRTASTTIENMWSGTRGHSRL